MAAANIHAALGRVLRWMQVAGAGMQTPAPSDADMRIWTMVRTAQMETGHA